MTTLAGIGGIGTPELMVILAICVLLFGPSRLPGLARSVGEGIREFKKGMSGTFPPEEPAGDEIKPSEAKVAEPQSAKSPESAPSETRS